MTTPPPARLTRPVLERSAPLRRFDGLFGPPRPPAAGPSPAPANAAAPTGSADPVARGVELGYRVIDDYLRQGQALAQAAWSPLAPAAGGEPQLAADRLLQYASGLASAWLDYLQLTVAPGSSSGVAAPEPGRSTIPGFDLGPANGATEPRGAAPSTPWAAPAAASRAVVSPAAPASGAITVCVQMTSAKTTETSVELKPGALGAGLCAHDLRAGDAALPRIGAIELLEDLPAQRLTVRIQVPATQPAATYSGLIVDTRDNLPRGTLTVRVLD